MKYFNAFPSYSYFYKNKNIFALKLCTNEERLFIKDTKMDFWVGKFLERPGG